LSIGSPGVASPIGSPGAEDGSRSGARDARRCGHEAEVEAARRSLAEGDRDRALAHLERARELAAACERKMERAPDPGTTGPASALGMAPAGRIGSPQRASTNDSSPRI
jgi:hypothetical protein